MRLSSTIGFLVPLTIALYVLSPKNLFLKVMDQKSKIKTEFKHGIMLISIFVSLTPYIIKKPKEKSPTI